MPFQLRNCVKALNGILGTHQASSIALTSHTLSQLFGQWTVNVNGVMFLYWLHSLTAGPALTQSVCVKQNMQLLNFCTTRMWTNAQGDCRPAEYRWRPLFNAAVLLTPTTRVPCRNAAKMRNPLKSAGVPKLTKRSQLLVGQSSPYCRDICGRYCCLTSFFSDCQYVS